MKQPLIVRIFSWHWKAVPEQTLWFATSGVLISLNDFIIRIDGLEFLG